jgi:hypothetical protein
VKLFTLQPALACPPPSTVAAVHLTLTADSGTMAQPMKLDEFVPTLKVHVFPNFPWVIFQVTVATEPPGTAPPGSLAVNGILLGVARSRLTRLKPQAGTGWLPDGKTGVVWRGLTVDFCAHASPTTNMNTPAPASKMHFRISVYLLS